MNATGATLGYRLDFPKRKRVRQKTILFSIAVSVVVTILSAVVFYFNDAYLPIKKLEALNHRASNQIRCDSKACDMSDISTDWESDGPDYILDKQTSFILNATLPGADFRNFTLRYSDPSFFKQFFTPAEVTTPSGETWRLFTVEKQLAQAQVAVMVGFAERVPWKMELPTAPRSAIDAALKVQAERIVSALRDDGDVPISATKKLSVDGFEIVDLTTNRILHWGYEIPVYFPHSRPVPRPGTSLYNDDDDIYLVRTDATDRLLVVSTTAMGDWRYLVAFFGLLIVSSGLLAYVLGRTVLRKYFVFHQAFVTTVAEALKSGEGPSIEFKRSLAFDSIASVEQVLQTIVAFANTEDGTLFIGIEDDGKIKGISLDGPKHRDQFTQRIYQLARQRIKPSPSIQVDFVEVRDILVARVFVPRGDEPLYFLDGVIYVRYGSSDIKAQPEIVKKLLIQYAF